MLLLLRFTKAKAARRAASASPGACGSGVSIFRTSAPMSASIIVQNSPGATRASSMILMPSSTPMVVSPGESPRPCSVEVAGQARGERADVRDVLQVRGLLGHRLGLAARQSALGATQKLRAQALRRERLVGMALGAARGCLDGAAVGEAELHASPGLLRQLVGQGVVDHHPHATHEVAQGGI